MSRTPWSAKFFLLCDLICLLGRNIDRTIDRRTGRASLVLPRYLLIPAYRADLAGKDFADVDDPERDMKRIARLEEAQVSLGRLP